MTQVFNEGTPRLATLRSALGHRVTREQLLAGLIVMAFVNGALLRAYDALDLAGPYGWPGAAMSTFGISVIVWAAIWIGLQYLLQGQQTRIRSLDGVVAGAAVVLTVLPSSVPAWLAMTVLSLYAAATVPVGSVQRRGAWILFAITIPMCWSRIVFAALSDTFLELEAMLIGAAMGTPQVGNLVQFADGSGYMEIWPACSSFANVSLALLCWVTFCQVNGRRAFTADGVGWCLLACAAVIVVNITRISLIGFFPAHYELLHGSVGYSIAGWLTLGASVAVCVLGVRSPRVAHQTGGAKMAHG